MLMSSPWTVKPELTTTHRVSVLRTEMTDLESQEEDPPPRILFYKSMSWMEQIWPHHRDEVCPDTLWQTFFSVFLGVPIPVIVEKSFAVCGWRKFQTDTLDDHLGMCTVHSGAKKLHDRVVDQLVDLFHTTHRVKTQQVVKNRGVSIAGTLSFQVTYKMRWGRCLCKSTSSSQYRDRTTLTLNKFIPHVYF